MSVLEMLQNAPSGSELLKAIRSNQAVATSQEQLTVPKSAIIDPLNAMNYMGTRAKPTVIPLQTLRNMAKIPAISAIIRTRQNQVARFARPPRFAGDIGFFIALKDLDAKMTAADKKEAKRITDFIMQTGSVKNRIRRDNFDRFLRKVVSDSLILDQMCWENVPDRRGELAEIWALDAATIELVVQEPVSEMYDLPVYRPMTRKGIEIAGEIAYVQRVDGQIVAEYTEDEMCFAVRNPHTDINYAPFGRAELEDLYEIVTAIVNGMRYNTSYFSASSLPQGVLEIIGKYDDAALEGFRRHWKVMTSGAAGKWAVPVMAMTDGQGLKFTEFKKSNRDMEFNQFLEFLFNVACAVWQIDPNEVGFKSWSSKTGGLSQSDNTKEKIEQSQDKGFVPLMTFIENSITSEVIDRINPDFALTFIGVDEEGESARLEKSKMRLEAGLSTPNLERARLDEEPIKAEWADAPANSQLIQVFMKGKDAEMQQQQLDQQGQQQQDLAQLNHRNAKEMAGMQHNNALQQQEHAQKFQGNEGAMGRFHDEKMRDKAHEQGKEMAGIQHEQSKDMEQGKQAHARVMAEVGHGHRNNELAEKAKHDGAARQDEHEFQRSEGSMGRFHDEKMRDKAHEQAKEKVLEGKAGSKGKLQKSLNDIYLMDNPLVERLAKRVHEAWKRTAGTSDNPDMTDYESLHEAVKETDRACARAVVEQLVAEGLVPSEAQLNKAIDTAQIMQEAGELVVYVNPWDIY